MNQSMEDFLNDVFGSDLFRPSRDITRLQLARELMKLSIAMKNYAKLLPAPGEKSCA